jgi:hypothetical protein
MKKNIVDSRQLHPCGDTSILMNFVTLDDLMPVSALIRLTACSRLTRGRKLMVTGNT